MGAVAGYESGLGYETLKAMADANVIDTIGRGTLCKNRNKWRGTLTYYITEDGRRKQVRVNHTFVDTRTNGRDKTSESQARALLEDWRASVIEDVLKISGLDNDPTRPTKDCVDRFIESKKIVGDDGEMVGVRHSTLTFYRSCAKRLEMSPALANKPLNAVRKADVQAWVNTMARTLARKSITDSLNILKQTCAGVLGGSSPNPCMGVRVPMNARRGRRNSQAVRPNALNADGVRALNTLLDEREAKYDGPDGMAVGARIALHTGMRAEEVAGLKWSCVDFINRQIYVENVIERAVIDDEYTELDASPKTEKSNRRIHIDTELMRILLIHKESTVAILGTMPKSKRPEISDLYVIGDTQGKHYSPHRLGANFKKFCKTRNIRGTEGDVVGFHDLRHTFATLALSQHPERLSEISATLGHSNINVTLNKYVGSDKQAQRDFMDAMEEVFAARLPEGVTMLRTGTDGE